jgi:hypothetical protein
MTNSLECLSSCELLDDKLAAKNAEIEKLKECVSFYADKKNWSLQVANPRGTVKNSFDDADCDERDDFFTVTHGGKRARAALAQMENK